MLHIRLINDQAAVNNFFYVDSKDYVADQDFTIKFQILDEQLNNRLMPTVDATCKVTFQKSDGSELELTADMLFPDDDRSMWKVDVTAANSLLIVGSNFRVDLDVAGDATDMRTGMAYNVISIITFDGDC